MCSYSQPAPSGHESASLWSFCRVPHTYAVSWSSLVLSLAKVTAHNFQQANHDNASLGMIFLSSHSSRSQNRWQNFQLFVYGCWVSWSFQNLSSARLEAPRAYSSVLRSSYESRLQASGRMAVRRWGILGAHSRLSAYLSICWFLWLRTRSFPWTLSSLLPIFRSAFELWCARPSNLLSLRQACLTSLRCSDCRCWFLWQVTLFGCLTLL